MHYAVFTEGVDEITVHGLTQWDKGQKLQINLSSLPAQFQVHFASKRAETAFVVDANASDGVGVISIPNAILRQPVNAVAWLYVSEGDAGETIKTINLPIQRRSKPDDYIYEESEVADFKGIVDERVDAFLTEFGAIGKIEATSAELEEQSAEIAAIKDFTLNRIAFEHAGNPVQLDTFSGNPLNVITTLAPIQSGSGDPYPAGGGKNLLPYFSAETKNGIALSVANDGTITLNGTPSAETNFVVYLPSALPTETYTMSLRSNAVNGYVAVWLENTNDWSIIGNVSNDALNNSVSFESTKAYHRAKLNIHKDAGTLNNLQLKIQLEKGSTATEYAPYANIRTIS